MKNKFIRKWLVILTVAAMMIPAGIPANAETVEEGEISRRQREYQQKRRM